MSDAELIQRLRGGEESAARELVARVEPVVRRIVVAYATSVTEVEDWSQDVFVRMVERIGQFDGRAPLEHWVAKVALRVCLDRLRQRRVLRGREVAIESVEWFRGAVSTREQNDPGHSVTARDLVARLLEQLAPEDRQVIQLLDLEERSVSEVADLLGRSASWVKVRAHRARRWLDESCRHLLEG